MSTPYITSIERRGIEKGIQQGLEQGILQGERQLLVRQARLRFGEAAAKSLETFVEPIQEADCLAEVGAWIIQCESGDALLAKLQNTSEHH